MKSHYMMNVQQLLTRLKKSGGRSTPLRETLLNLILTANKPLSAPELLEILETLGNKVNKTSVYRQLQLFVETGIVRELQLDKDRLYYELADLEHHHHLICNNCQKIEHIEVKNIEHHIDVLEKETEFESGFKIKSHMLEFYGLCRKCINV